MVSGVAFVKFFHVFPVPGSSAPQTPPVVPLKTNVLPSSVPALRVPKVATTPTTWPRSRWWRPTVPYGTPPSPSAVSRWSRCWHASSWSEKSRRLSVRRKGTETNLLPESTDCCANLARLWISQVKTPARGRCVIYATQKVGLLTSQRNITQTYHNLHTAHALPNSGTFEVEKCR